MKKSFFEFYQMVKEAAPVASAPPPPKPGAPAPMPGAAPAPGATPQAPAAPAAAPAPAPAPSPSNQAQVGGQGVSPPIPQIPQQVFDMVKQMTPDVMKIAAANPQLKAAWDKFNATLNQAAPSNGGTQPNAQQRPQTAAPTPAGSPPPQQAAAAPHA